MCWFSNYLNILNNFNLDQLIFLKCRFDKSRENSLWPTKFSWFEDKKFKTPIFQYLLDNKWKQGAKPILYFTQRNKWQHIHSYNFNYYKICYKTNNNINNLRKTISSVIQVLLDSGLSCISVIYSINLWC